MSKVEHRGKNRTKQLTFGIQNRVSLKSGSRHKFLKIRKAPVNREKHNKCE